MKEFLLFGKDFKRVDQWQKGCWIKVTQPNDDELDYLRELGVPESFISDISDADERPRTENDGDWLLTVLRVPRPSQDDDIPYTTVPVGVITNNDIVAVLCYYDNEVIDDFIQYNGMRNREVPNRVVLIMRLILSSAVWFLKYLKVMNVDINNAEDGLERSIRNEDLLKLRNMQKSLVYFNTSIRGNESLLLRLRTRFQNTGLIDNDLIEDVDIELQQALNTVKVYTDILTGTMDAFASIISNNLNVIMKRMTSISIILMLPTFIASLYGMNVALPVETASWAFAFILVLCVVLSAGAFFLFKRIKWF